MDKLYKTKDLPEIAVFLIKKQKPVKVEQENGIYWFTFNAKNTEKISNDYYYGELLVNARDFYETMKMLKGKIVASNGF